MSACIRACPRCEETTCGIFTSSVGSQEACVSAVVTIDSEITFTESRIRLPRVTKLLKLVGQINGFLCSSAFLRLPENDEISTVVIECHQSLSTVSIGVSPATYVQIRVSERCVLI